MIEERIVTQDALPVALLEAAMQLHLHEGEDNIISENGFVIEDLIADTLSEPSKQERLNKFDETIGEHFTEAITIRERIDQFFELKELDQGLLTEITIDRNMDKLCFKDESITRKKKLQGAAAVEYRFPQDFADMLIRDSALKNSFPKNARPVNKIWGLGNRTTWGSVRKISLKNWLTTKESLR